MDSNLYNKKTYTVLVAGDVDLSEYDLNKKVNPYIVYRFSERNKIRQQAITFYEEFLKNAKNIPEKELLLPFMQCKLQDIIEMSDEEYFEEISKGMIFDKNTGDALTDINPLGKYRSLTNADEKYTLPLKGKLFECQVGELELSNKTNEDSEKYAKHWDYIMNCAPFVKEEYISSYKDKETYVRLMTEPLFYNAFVSNKTGWLEQGDENQVQWVLTFNDRFIKDLPKDTKLKVYNFTR